MSDPFDDVVAAVQAASALITISRDLDDPEIASAHLYLLDNVMPIPPALMAEILRRSADELDPKMSPAGATPRAPERGSATPGTSDALPSPGVVPSS